MSQLNPRCQSAFTVSGVAANSPYFQIKTLALSVPEYSRRLAIRSVAIEFVDATATDIGLVRAATPGTVDDLVGYESLQWPDTGSRAFDYAQIATSWIVAPTLYGGGADIFIQDFSSRGIAGTSLLWLFDESAPLIVGSGVLDSAHLNIIAPTLVLWNTGSGMGGDLKVTLSFGIP